MFLLLKNPRKIRTTYFSSKLIQDPPKTRNFLPTLLVNFTRQGLQGHPGKNQGLKNQAVGLNSRAPAFPYPLRKLSQRKMRVFK